MPEIASARINTFGTSPKANSVSPSEDAIFVLTSAQLQSIITGAIQEVTGTIDRLQSERDKDYQNLIAEAIQPLQDEVSQLRAIVAAQDRKIADLQATEEHDVNRICLDIAYDRQRLARLEKVEPQPLQKDRGEILRALLAANGGKMLAKDARQKMHLSRSRFSELLVVLERDIEVKPYHLKRNQNVLVLK